MAGKRQPTSCGSGVRPSVRLCSAAAAAAATFSAAAMKRNEKPFLQTTQTTNERCNDSRLLHQLDGRTSPLSRPDLLLLRLFGPTGRPREFTGRRGAMALLNSGS